MLNYKDYMQIQTPEDMKCSCCEYTVIAGSNIWVTSPSKKDAPLCTPCWDKKRHEQECINHQGGKNEKI